MFEKQIARVKMVLAGGTMLCNKGLAAWNHK
jgi:hypothetical protein